MRNTLLLWIPFGREYFQHMLFIVRFINIMILSVVKTTIIMLLTLIDIFETYLQLIGMLYLWYRPYNPMLTFIGLSCIISTMYVKNGYHMFFNISSFHLQVFRDEKYPHSPTVWCYLICLFYSHQSQQIVLICQSVLALGYNPVYTE